jgi:hypothetical protein
MIEPLPAEERAVTRPEPVRCAAENSHGQQCRNRVKGNSDWCRSHQLFPAHRFTGETRRRKLCPTIACVAFANLIEFIPTPGDVVLRWRCDAGHSFQEHLVTDIDGHTWVEAELMTRLDWMPAES